MVKCPNCGAEIDHLINWSDAEEKFIFRVNENGNIEYEYVDSIPKLRNEYCCPECGEVLFFDEELATKFLKGEISAEMWRFHRGKE